MHKYYGQNALLLMTLRHVCPSPVHVGPSWPNSSSWGSERKREKRRRILIFPSSLSLSAAPQSISPAFYNFGDLISLTDSLSHMIVDLFIRMSISYIYIERESFTRVQYITFSSFTIINFSSYVLVCTHVHVVIYYNIYIYVCVYSEPANRRGPDRDTSPNKEGAVALQNFHWFIIVLYHAVSPDQSKRTSRLVCDLVGISRKIPIDHPNLRFDHWITHLEI